MIDIVEDVRKAAVNQTSAPASPRGASNIRSLASISSSAGGGSVMIPSSPVTAAKVSAPSPSMSRSASSAALAKTPPTSAKFPDITRKTADGPELKRPVPVRSQSPAPPKMDAIKEEKGSLVNAKPDEKKEEKKDGGAPKPSQMDLYQQTPAAAVAAKEPPGWRVRCVVHLIRMLGLHFD